MAQERGKLCKTVEKGKLSKWRIEMIKEEYREGGGPKTQDFCGPSRHLATDRDVEVRVAVAQNPNADPATLVALSGDWAWKVRGRVAKNPSAPKEVVRALAEDGDQSVKKAATRPER